MHETRHRPNCRRHRLRSAARRPFSSCRMRRSSKNRTRTKWRSLCVCPAGKHTAHNCIAEATTSVHHGSEWIPFIIVPRVLFFISVLWKRDERYFTRDKIWISRQTSLRSSCNLKLSITILLLNFYIFLIALFVIYILIALFVIYIL